MSSKPKVSPGALSDDAVPTITRDVGCAQALGMLHVYVDLVATGAQAEAERRYPGIAAHLRACGPCGQDFEELLAAVCGETD